MQEYFHTYVLVWSYILLVGFPGKNESEKNNYYVAGYLLRNKNTY